MKGVTTRERFLRTLRFQPVDRPPNFEWGYWGQTIERWVKEGMPPDAAVYKPEEAVLAGIEETGIPTHQGLMQYRTCTAALWGHPYFGIEGMLRLGINYSALPPFETRVIEENERTILFRDSQGILRRSLKEGMIRDVTWSMDTYIDFPVKNREDWEEMKKRYDPHDPNRYPLNWSEIVKHYPKMNRPVILGWGTGFYSKMRQLMGTVGISKAFFTKPNLVHEMMDFFADFYIEVNRKALNEIKVDAYLFFEDFAYKKGPHISPRIFKKFMLPRFKRLTKFLRNKGVDIIMLDSDGNTEALIPWVIEAGITCHWPLESAAGMDPRKIRKEYGHRLALMGGIDKRVLGKNKEEVKREVMSKIPKLVADGGYVPMIDHNISPEASYENFLYYLELKLQAMQQG